MNTPCNQCPFRVKDIFYFEKKKRQNIVNVLTSKERGFPCHKTVRWERGERILPEESPCVGAAMLILNDQGSPTGYLKKAEKEGKINLDHVYSRDPIYESFSAFVEAGN